jgi:hypothetical protein
MSISSETAETGAVRANVKEFAFEAIVRQICRLNWTALSDENLISVAWVYYYFSIQFRESLEIARQLYPEDPRLLQLDLGERDTDNLSPWPGIAAAKEKMNHDEFMRRTIGLTELSEDRRRDLTAIGQTYLSRVRATDPDTMALALASYEDGGLESVFRAILTAPHWDGPLLEAFKHFLVKHIEFDSDPEHGHGALCRHLSPDDRILPLWAEFKQMLITAAPPLTSTERLQAEAGVK